MADRSRRQVKKNLDLQRIMLKEKERSKVREIRKILKKPNLDRSEDELKILDNSPHIVHQVHDTMQKHKCLKERTKEVIDGPQVLTEKCCQLAKAIKESAFTVVYTGAGISTSAHIPDYRGPDGIWTLLQKGKDIIFQDLSMAEPTYTHMALKQLHKERMISNVVSQNCDGLHLRSGLPRNALSEVHGNMFIEVCSKCKPLKQYVRLFDVTERTGLHRHKTGRFCKKCGFDLNDTIVHFGEKGTLPWPMNWKGAAKAAAKADLILCLGTSLKVLRRYQGLWVTNKPHAKRPKLYIVNLQWTPKDSQATLKIHGKCDDVMKQVMSFLEIEVPKYERKTDPIFQMAVPLLSDEESTTTRFLLSKDTKSEDLAETIINQEYNYAITKSSDEQTLTDLLYCDKRKKGQLIHKDSKLITGDGIQPYVKLLDICSASTNELIKLNAEKIDSRTFFIRSKNTQETGNAQALSGWYGKGCSKWKKYKRKANSVYKRPKLEKVV